MDFTTQQYGYPYGYPQQPYNYNYNGVQGQKYNNFLSDEEVKALRQKGPEFSLGLTQDEIIRAGCNHREIGGMKDTLTQDPLTGKYVCTICGEKFNPVTDDTEEAVTEWMERGVDILNTIKMMYYDLPANPAREYFQILPLIKKVPQIYKLAVESFNKHDVSQGWKYGNQQPDAVSMFMNMNNNVFGQAPMYGYPQGAPVGQAPMYNPAPQAPYVGTPMFNNGFGYPGAGQAPAYQPQMNNFAYQPGVAPAAATPVAPQAPAAPAADVTKTVQA